MPRIKSGGGWQAIRYTLRKAREVGPLRFWRAMRSKNACKTCAFGMGGQLGGMTNEARRFPEVCKKSLQAMAADMQGRIDPKFFATYNLDELRGLSPRELEMVGRLVDPVIKRPDSDRYEPITWDEALDVIVHAMKETRPDRSFFYSSGRSSNEAGFLMQLLARAYGTNHVNNCSFYCHQASGVGLKESIGTGTATIELDDLEKCDLVFLIGANPSSNHPRLMTMLMNLRRRGGRVIVVNPIKEVGLQNFKVPSSARSMLFGSEIASTYLQPTIGGDIALLTGIAKALLATDGIDQAFVESATEGFAELRSLVEKTSWEEIASASGISREQIEDVAGQYSEAKNAIFAWSMGITHHVHGVQNVQWIVNLALLRGMIGKPGSGLLPIRGHSNVQGLGSIGVTPALSQAAIKRMEELGLTPPLTEGHDTMSATEAASRGEVDFAFCLGGNLYGASPEAEHVGESLRKIKTIVYLSTSLNTGHAHGTGDTTIILPVSARDEEPQSTTQESMFNYVRLSDGGPARHQGTRSEVEIISEIGDRTLGTTGKLVWKDLASHDAIRKLISETVPGFEQLTSIGATKQEFHIPGRVLHSPKFKTRTGRAAFRAHPIPKTGSGQLRLMTIRSEGQFNTVVYEESDIYRGQERRDVILMNRLDIARLALRVDQFVDVYNEVGRMRNIRVREFDIAEGCAMMYYPEANALVPRTVDPRSKTPAFKSVVVTLSPSEDGPLEAENGSEVSANRSGLKAC